MSSFLPGRGERRLHRAVRLALLGLALAATAAPAAAADPRRLEDIAPRSYSIAAGPLGRTLASFAATTGVALSFDPALTEGLSSPALNGSYAPRAALNLLLAGSGLEIVLLADGSYTLRKLPAATAGGGTSSTLPEVKVNANRDGGELPEAYAGGQAARGGRLGVLGNRDVMETPFSTINYTEQMMRDQQARTVRDVVENDPSVRDQSSRSNIVESYIIRGFAVNNGDIAYNGMFGILPASKNSVAGAERVEFLKGPSALLYGMAPSGGIGGTLNIVPKRAGDDDLTRLTGNYVTDSNFGGQLDVGRRFGADKQFGIRMNVAAQDGRTLRSEYSQGERELTLGLDYRSERVRLSVDLGYLQWKYRGTEGFLTPAAGAQVPSAPDPNGRVYQPWTFWNSDNYYGVMRGEFDLSSSVTAHAAIGGRDSVEKYVLPFGTGLTTAGNFTEGYLNSTAYNRAKTGDFGLSGRFSTGPVGHEVALDVTRLYIETGQVSAVLASNASNIYQPANISRPAIADLGSARKTGESRLDSTVLADTLSAWDRRVLFTLGARQQNVRATSYNATTAAQISFYDKSALTPMAGLVLKPWRNVSLYGNYIEGLSQGPTAPAGTLNAGQVFEPFKSKQKEVGAKVDLGRMMATAAVFEITKPSAFTNASNVYVVDGEQRNRGYELGLVGEAAPHVRVMGGFTMVDAIQTKTAGGTFDGKNAISVPRMNVSVGGEWDTPFEPRLTLTGRAIASGSFYVDQANNQTAPGWTRYDIGARYKTTGYNNKPLVFSASVKNLFDKGYWISNALYRGEPRSLWLSASMEF